MKINQTVILFAVLGLAIGGAAGYWLGQGTATNEEYLQKIVHRDCFIECADNGGSIYSCADECDRSKELGTDDEYLQKTYKKDYWYLFLVGKL